MHNTPSGPEGSAEPTPTLDEFADLQAGLLDDAAAAPPGRPRHQVTGPAARQAAHARRPSSMRLKSLGAAAGVAALVVAILVGTAALRSADSPARARVAVAAAEHITVAVPPPTIPLRPPQVAALLDRPADYGASGVLSDPARRASCLSGLGYPSSTRVLGAVPMNLGSWPAVVLILPADDAGHLHAVAVAPNCSAADTGVIADTTLPRP